MSDITVPIPRDEDAISRMDPNDPARKDYEIFKSIQEKQLRFKCGPAAVQAGLIDANGYRREPPQQP